MSIRLGRALVARGMLAQRDLDVALFESVRRGVHLARALVDLHLLAPAGLEQALTRAGEPLAARAVGDLDLARRLPPGLSRRLLAVPLRLDPLLGEALVAALDPADPHTREEIAYHLGTNIRLVRASLLVLEDGLTRLEAELQRPAVPSASASPGAAPGTPQANAEGRKPEPAEASSSPPPLLPERPIRRTAPIGLAPEAEVKKPAADHLATDVPIPLLRKPSLRPRSVVGVGSTPPSPLADDPVLPLRNSKPPRPAIQFDLGSRSPGVPGGSVPPPASSQPGSGPPSSEPRAEPQVDLPLADPASVFGALERASDVEEILRATLRGLHQVARRVAVFSVRQGTFEGRACNVAFADPDALRELRVPTNEPSVLATALVTGLYFGPVPVTPALVPLLELMGSASDSFAVAVVRAGQVPALLLVADEVVHSAPGTRRMGELAGKVGAALGRVARERR